MSPIEAVDRVTLALAHIRIEVAAARVLARDLSERLDVPPDHADVPMLGEALEQALARITDQMEAVAVGLPLIRPTLVAGAPS